VFMQNLPTVICNEKEMNTETGDSVLQSDETLRGNTEERENSEPEANDKQDTARTESNCLTVGDETVKPLNSEHEDATEADRNHLTSANKLSKVTIMKTTGVMNRKLRKSCFSKVMDVATVEVSHGRWVDLSD